MSLIPEPTSAKVHMSVIGRDDGHYPPPEWRAKSALSHGDVENPLPPIFLEEEAPAEFYTVAEYYFKFGFGEFN